MQVPGVLLAACRIMSVTHVGSGRVGALVGVVDAGLLGGGWLRACRGCLRGRRQNATIAQLVPGVSGCLRGRRQNATIAQLVPGAPACSRDAVTVWPAPGVPD